MRRHQSQVRGLLRQLTGNDALADDLAQETFLRAYRSLGQFRGGARLATWLCSIAYNAWVSHARKPVLQLAPPKQQGSMDRVLARHDLSRAMAELRPEERAALALTYAEELTHEEAAEIMNWPLGTLKTHVLRAKDKLRARLRGAAQRPEAAS